MGTDNAGTDAPLLQQGAQLLARTRRTPTITVLGLGLLSFPGLVYLDWPRPIYEQQRIVQVIALLMVILLALARRQLDECPWPRTTAARAGLVTLLISGGLSVALAAAPAVAVRHASLTALLVLGAAVAADETAKQGTVPLQAALVAFAAFAGLTTTVLALLVPSESVHPSVFAWANPRFLGQAVSWTFPGLLGLTVARQGLPRYALATLCTGWAGLAVFSGARGTWVALLIALVAGAVVAGRHRRAWLRLGFGAMIVGGPLGLLMNLSSGSSRSMERLVQDSGRLEILGRTFGLWLERPWFGLGPGGLSVFGAPPSHPHNAPLQILAEWGVLTFAAVLLLLVGIALATRTRRACWRERLEDPFMVGLVASLAAGAAHSLVSGILVTPASQLLLVLVLGGLAARHRRPPRNQASHLWTVVGVLAVIGLGVTTVTTRPAELDRRHPRFWLVSPESFRELP